jgi:hypothetical protein
MTAATHTIEVDFAENADLQRWIEQQTVLGGFTSPADFIRSALTSVYVDTFGYLNANVEVTDEWRRAIQEERQPVSRSKGSAND